VLGRALEREAAVLDLAAALLEQAKAKRR
jgi:hypothetical protein